MKIGQHFFQVYRVSAKGLEAQRTAMGTATENIANAQTTRTADGTPYKAKRSVQVLDKSTGITFANTLAKLSNRLGFNRTSDLHRQPADRSSDPLRSATTELAPETEIVESDSVRMEFDPTHPDADENGYVAYPDVDVIQEMAELVSANRLYEANLASVQAMTQAIKRTIDI